MAARKQLLGALIVALVGGVLLFSSPLRAADPTPIACPNGQTIFLVGATTPREALLVYLGGRAVGGGLSDASGNYRLPLRAQEKPGAYLVEVRLRSNRTVVGRFTCFVDVPVGAEPTPSPTLAAPAPTARPSAPTQAPAPTSRAGGTTPSPTTAGTSATSRTTTPSVSATSGGTATITPTGPTATPTVTRTGGPTPSPTSTGGAGSGSPSPTPRVGSVVIDEVVLLDPAYAESEEFVQIRNADNIDHNIGGWRLINATRSGAPSFTFPSFLLEADFTAALYSQVGNDDLDGGDFYWDQPNSVWSVGDRVELRDAQNRLIHSYIVPQQ